MNQDCYFDLQIRVKEPVVQKLFKPKRATRTSIEARDPGGVIAIASVSHGSELHAFLANLGFRIGYLRCTNFGWVGAG